MKKILIMFLFLNLNTQLRAMQLPHKGYNQEKTKELRYRLGLLGAQGAMNENRMETAAQNINILVAAGADPNAEGNLYHLFSLNWAAFYGFLDTMHLLLECGANPNLQDSIALFSVFESVHTSMKTKAQALKLLLVYGADPNKTKDKINVYSFVPFKQTPLSLALNCSNDLCYMLFEYGADPLTLSEIERNRLMRKLE